MNKYRINIKLLTESIFGSGHSVPGSVDLEVVHDEYGFPYMRAKTFKGNLREAMEDAIEVIGEEYKYIVDGLLGEENRGEELWKSLKFSDCQINEKLRNALKQGVAIGEISSSEIKDALTDIRNFTSIDENGTAIKGSLRQIRVIKKDLEFEVELYCERELSKIELGLLAISIKTLRHLGTMKTRGKGEVECILSTFEDGRYKDTTDAYIDSFLKEVNLDE